MKKTIVALLLLAAVAGCGDSKKTDGEKKADETQPQQPPVLTAKESDRDPRGLHAKRLSEVIEGHRKAIGVNIDAVAKGEKYARELKDFTDPKVIETLRTGLSNAIDHVHHMDEELLSLDRELRHGQNAFAAYAQAFRDRAEDHSDYSKKEATLAWAAHYDALAKGIPDERARVAEFRTHIPPLLEYLRGGRRLCDDYHLFLSTYHDQSFPASEAAEYRKRFKEHLKQFDDFQRFIDAYRTPGSGGSKIDGGTLARANPS